MAVANAHPFQLTKEDAADFVDRELADRPNETAYVLMHSIMWQYMPDATKARIEAALARHGDDATRRHRSRICGWSPRRGKAAMHCCR